MTAKGTHSRRRTRTRKSDLPKLPPQIHSAEQLDLLTGRAAPPPAGHLFDPRSIAKGRPDSGSLLAKMIASQPIRLAPAAPCGLFRETQPNTKERNR